MIEYTALAVLAMLAILVMGSYVVRSINAYFKSSEDTIDESYSEILLQSNRGVEGMNCRCDIFEEADHCGPHGEVNCQPYEIAVHYQCEPEGPACPKYWGCKYAREACCGDDGDCNDDDPDHPCPYGQRAYFTNCKNEPVAYYCEEDASCRHHCNPIDLPHNDGDRPNPDYTQWCMIDGMPAGPRPRGLLEDTDVVYVDEGECTGIPCEAECLDPLVRRIGQSRSSGYSICDCPFDEIFKGTRLCCHKKSIYNETSDYCVYGEEILNHDNIPSDQIHEVHTLPVANNGSIGAIGYRTPRVSYNTGYPFYKRLHFSSYIYFRNPKDAPLEKLEWYYAGQMCEHTMLQDPTPGDNVFDYDEPQIIHFEYDLNTNMLTWSYHNPYPWSDNGSAHVPWSSSYQVVLLYRLVHQSGIDERWIQVQIDPPSRRTNYYIVTTDVRYMTNYKDYQAPFFLPFAVVFSEQAIRLNNPGLDENFYDDYRAFPGNFIYKKCSEL